MEKRLRVVETDFWDDPRWDRFVSEHPQGSIYHHSLWLRALKEEFGQKSLSLACVDRKGDFQGILPLFYTRGLPFGLSHFGQQSVGRRLASLPRTPIAGPLALSTEATTALINAAVERARQEPGVQIQLKTLTGELDGLVQGLVRTPWRLSYVLQLSAASEQPFQINDSHNRARIKWAINKAARSGVYARQAETDTELAAWYMLYLDTMRRDAVPPRPFRFFVALWETLKPRGMMQLLLAEQQTAARRRIIAGSIFLMFGRTVSYAFNGSECRDLGLRPNDVIQWQAINDACKRGFRSFDFGEVPEGHDGLARFKRKWGAVPTPLYRYYYPPPQELESGVAESPGRLRLLAEAVWRRLPLKATAVIGDRLYGYL
jgi:hypothetical protein